jgi:voltage-gated sodium channel
MFKKLFLNDKFILAFILINSGIIYAQVSGCEHKVLDITDLVCTLIFLVEMIVKHVVFGFRGYWKDGWNKLDGTLVICSIPSIISFFLPVSAANLSLLLILRLLRVLRFFRVLHFFPNFSKLVDGFKAALRQSYAILLSFFVIVVIIGLINCSLFGEADPEHFQTPFRSIYSVFQICTVEGWYEIPNTVAEYYGASTFVADFVRVYFCFILIMGGIIGMSFINSIFVDAMVSGNNNELEEQVAALNEKVDQLLKMQSDKTIHKE